MGVRLRLTSIVPLVSNAKIVSVDSDFSHVSAVVTVARVVASSVSVKLTTLPPAGSTVLGIVGVATSESFEHDAKIEAEITAIEKINFFIKNSFVLHCAAVNKKYVCLL